MAKLLNIEVGDSFVKVALTEKKKTGVTLKKAFMVETPVGTTADGVIADPAALGSALTPKLHEHGMSGVKHVVFTLVSGKVATRDVMLPPVKESRVKSVVEANANEYFPVDISRYLVSYGMLKTVNEGNVSGTHLTAIAAPLQLLDGYIRLAEKMNLEIQGIDYYGNSQFQVVKALGSKKIIMNIMVSGNHTCITIAKGDRLILQRMLPWGGDDFVDAYMNVMGDDESNYELALKRCSISLKDFIAGNILSQDEMHRAFNRIIGGISRSMDFFNSSRWSAPLDEIILTGNCARLAGLRENISTALGGADVRLLEEYLSDAPNSALHGDTTMISAYLSAYGSAFAPVDLIPDKYKATKDKKKSSEHGIIGAIIIFVTCLLAGGIMALFAMYENHMLTRELNDIRQDIDNLRHVEAEHARFIQYQAAANTFNLLEEANRTNNRGLVDFFTELEEKMPSDMLLMSAVCTNESVIMNIRVPSLEAAAMVIAQFRTFESVGQVDISAISEGQDEAGFAFQTFTVTCVYYVPEITEDEPAAHVVTESEED